MSLFVTEPATLFRSREAVAGELKPNSVVDGVIRISAQTPAGHSCALEFAASATIHEVNVLTDAAEDLCIGLQQ